MKPSRTMLNLLFAGFSSMAFGQVNTVQLSAEKLELKDTDTIISRSENLTTGELRYMSGGLIIVIQYENGYRTKETVYFSNGAEKSEHRFKNGKMHGYFHESTNAGQPKASGYYAHGIEDGLWTYYYVNGVKECEGAYVADTTRLITDFSLAKSITNTEPPFDVSDITLSFTKHAPPHGEWYFYDREGQLIKTLLFEYGHLKGIRLAEEEGHASDFIHR
jgi:antitoxin component YwqK of YwqJK toxin-antitoxin module